MLFSIKDRKINWDMVGKVLVIMLADVIATAMSVFFGFWFRFEFSIDKIPLNYIEGYLQVVGPWCAITIAVFLLFGLYNSIWAYVSTSELYRIIGAYGVIAVIGLILLRFDGTIMPRSSQVVALMCSFLCTSAIRFAFRFKSDAMRKMVRVHRGGIQNVMIIGAGDAGRTLLNEYRTSKFMTDNVACIIDDNELKKHRRIYGVPVVGGRNEIPAAVKEYRISKIVFAIPSISAAARKEILDICTTTGCEVHILPGIYQLLNGEVSVGKLRKVDPQDLLGRDPVRVNMDEILAYVSGKTVLVSGGGGSIGSELCRQIARAKPRQLIILDIYENNAYDIQMELRQTCPELNLKVLIGSVRNETRLDDIMAHYRPDLVFHAAAHKHVPLMEDSPNEAIKNNVFGTYNMAKAASKYGVKRFVMISTDKAVNPTNIMGASKRLCEMVIQMMNRHSDTEFVAVRFGNVLGSNGSVVPLFKRQIAAGGPVTVTHPDIIRYFMTIPEAVSLVLQAGYYAHGGEIFVLDMGEPVKIDTMARNLIRLSGLEPDVDIKIEYTGLRPGEKLFEELLMKEEGLQETCNQRIHIGKPIEMDDERFLEQLDRLRAACESESDDIKHIVAEVVPTYKPSGEALVHP